MLIKTTKLTGVMLVESSPFLDERGAFCRLYCDHELADIIGERKILQVNHSRTQTRGALRGLHYQRPPNAEMKLVRCLSGRVWDVAVDLRMDSPTYLQWYAEELTADNFRMLVIPEGCAHGFQVLQENSELLYLTTAFYQASAEGGLRYDDPALNIEWPLPISQLSSKDLQHPYLDPVFTGLVL